MSDDTRGAFLGVVGEILADDVVEVMRNDDAGEPLPDLPVRLLPGIRKRLGEGVYEADVLR